LKTVVEGMLPARYLTQLGVYLQTCAHIENVCWGIYRMADPSAKELERSKPRSLINVKLSTNELIKKFRGCAKHCSLCTSVRILLAHQRLRDGVENRNAAAHGAWYYDAEDNCLRVEHYFVKFGDPKNKWWHIVEPVSNETIALALDEADLLLAELISIRELLKTNMEKARFSYQGNVKFVADRHGIFGERLRNGR